MNKACKTARTVATLLHLTAIGVEDTVTKVDPGLLRALYQQELITTNTKMAVGNETNLFSREGDGLVNGIEYHEVVTQAVHFGEIQ